MSEKLTEAVVRQQHDYGHNVAAEDAFEPSCYLCFALRLLDLTRREHEQTKHARDLYRTGERQQLALKEKAEGKLAELVNDKGFLYSKMALKVKDNYRKRAVEAETKLAKVCSEHGIEFISCGACG